MRLERPGYSGAVLVVIVTVAVSPMLVAIGQSGHAATPDVGTLDAPPDGTLAGDVDLEVADATVQGGPDDGAGAALAGGGDVDGDETADLLVGAPFADDGANRSGAAFLFSGPLAAGERDTAAANVTLLGENRSDRAGWDVALGDLDGDGSDDLVVGAPLNDAGGDGAGAVYVIYGAETLDGEVDLADADETFVGAAAGDRFGWAIATVSGADGEGDDLLVGAPLADENGSDSGAAYLFDGADLDDGTDAEDGTDAANADATNATAAEVTFVGTSAGDYAGTDVSTAGDVDGDGETDLAVGAPRADASDGTAVGAAYVVTGGHDGATSLADATIELVGADEADAAGWSVAAAGDVDADGYDDVVVGAPFNDSGGADAGAAYVARGGPDRSGSVNLSTAAGWYHGERDGDHAGWSVASAGASTGPCDGYADVLVGAPGTSGPLGANDTPGTNGTLGATDTLEANGTPDGTGTAADAGAAYLVTGGEDLATGANLSGATARVLGADEGDRAGATVAGVGDVSGDGNQDVAVGAPLNRSGGTASVLFGACPIPEVDGAGTDTPTPGETTAPTGSPTTAGTPSPADSPVATDTPTATPTRTASPTAAPAPSPTPTDTSTPPPTDTPTPTDAPDRTVVQTGDACYGETGAITVFGDGSSDDPITVTATDEEGGFVGEVVLTTEADSNELTVENGTYSLSAQRSDGRSVPVTQETVTVECEPVG